MAIKQTISFEDLVSECGFSERPKDFFRMIKRAGFHKNIRKNKPVDKKTACEIYTHFQGGNLDWYKYKLRYRDTGGGAALRFSDDANDIEMIEQKFLECIKTTDIENKSERFIGIFCSGGFLRGDQEREEFFLPLHNGINTLIGDRGSGKSTILNLSGILSPSTTVMTEALITSLLNLLNGSIETDKSLIRQIRKNLRHYDISEYYCYFIKAGETYCFYSNLESSVYCIYFNEEGLWVPCSKNKSNSILPLNIQMLMQGEVNRIAEKKDEYYLNKLIDSFRPEIYSKRKVVTKLLKNLSIQFKNSEFEYNEISGPKYGQLKQFVNERWDDYKKIDRAFQETDITGAIGIIDKHIGSCRTAQLSSSEEDTLFDLLQRNDDSLWHVYLGPIVGILSHFTDRLVLLRDMPEKDIVQFHKVVPKNETKEFEDWEFFVKQLYNYNDSGTNEIDSISDTSTYEYFTKSILLDKQQSQISDFIFWRLRYISYLLSTFSQKRIKFDLEVKGLLNSYKVICENRLSLLEMQENACNEISEDINDHRLPIKILTEDYNILMEADKNIIGGAENQEAIFENIYASGIKTKLSDLRNWITLYDSITNEATKKVETIASSPEESSGYLYHPITIQLRQGSVFRDFQRLSFGQRSGILLKIMITQTESKIIIIDQPEDNLDANAIINILTPTFNEQGKNKQIIIASHNSNLVLGLENSNVIAMESIGENGKVSAYGKSYESKIIKLMLNILEGGTTTFNQKIKAYEDFVNKLQGQISDIDISLIENSFRRRTIDKLRNYLQPPISDREVLKYLRHDLKNIQPTKLHNHLVETKQCIKVAHDNELRSYFNLLEELSELDTQIEQHIDRLQITINDLRLMDTQPTLSSTNLYVLLKEQKEYFYEVVRLPRKLKIDIDPKLADFLIIADSDHLKLIFRNLFWNSLRALETKTLDQFQRTHEWNAEYINIAIDSFSKKFINILFIDDGCGIDKGLINKLYVEKCSTQLGDHGLGGVIIRKLLEVNNSSIEILKSNTSGENIGTTQKIKLRIN